MSAKAAKQRAAERQAKREADAAAAAEPIAQISQHDTANGTSHTIPALASEAAPTKTDEASIEDIIIKACSFNGLAMLCDIADDADLAEMLMAAGSYVKIIDGFNVFFVEQRALIG